MASNIDRLRERVAQLDVQIREQRLKTQVLAASAESQRKLLDNRHGLTGGHGSLRESQQAMVDGIQSTRQAIRALIARIDAIIEEREKSDPT